MLHTEIRELDARGLACPLPVLRANKMLRGMGAGAHLRVIATDPSAPADFIQFCTVTGHRLLEQISEGEEFHILIEKVG